jgi:hypothetical protein
MLRPQGLTRSRAPSRRRSRLRPAPAFHRPRRPAKRGQRDAWFPAPAIATGSRSDWCIGRRAGARPGPDPARRAPASVQEQQRLGDRSYPCNAVVGVVLAGPCVGRPGGRVPGCACELSEARHSNEAHHDSRSHPLARANPERGSRLLQMRADWARCLPIGRVRGPFRPRSGLSWPKPQRRGHHHDARKHAICSYFPMARPGLEPGTPRFSGTGSRSPEGCDLRAFRRTR